MFYQKCWEILKFLPSPSDIFASSASLLLLFCFLIKLALKALSCVLKAVLFPSNVSAEGITNSPNGFWGSSFSLGGGGGFKSILSSSVRAISKLSITLSSSYLKLRWSWT